MRRLIVLVTVAAVAMAIAACSESDDGGPTSTTTATVVDRDVTATVSGRTIFGHCTGVATDAPTVVLDVGMGNPSLRTGQHRRPFLRARPGLHL
jgi:hypothetical protein